MGCMYHSLQSSTSCRLANSGSRWASATQWKARSHEAYQGYSHGSGMEMTSWLRRGSSRVAPLPPLRGRRGLGRVAVEPALDVVMENCLHHSIPAAAWRRTIASSAVTSAGATLAWYWSASLAPLGHHGGEAGAEVPGFGPERRRIRLWRRGASPSGSARRPWCRCGRGSRWRLADYVVGDAVLGEGRPRVP